MEKMKSIILTTVATACMIGLTAGASYSGSASHGKHYNKSSVKTSSKRTVKQSGTETGSTTGAGAGGITETRGTSETGAGVTIPEGFGARETVTSQYTVERIDPQGTGAAAGGSTAGTGAAAGGATATGTDATMDSGSDGPLNRETGGTTRDSGETLERQSIDETVEQRSGGTEDGETGWMRNRGAGGRLDETGRTGVTEGTLDKSGDTSIGSEGREEPRSGGTTGSGSSANPEVPR